MSCCSQLFFITVMFFDIYCIGIRLAFFFFFLEWEEDPKMSSAAFKVSLRDIFMNLPLQMYKLLQATKSLVLFSVNK